MFRECGLKFDFSTSKGEGGVHITQLESYGGNFPPLQLKISLVFALTYIQSKGWPWISFELTPLPQSNIHLSQQVCEGHWPTSCVGFWTCPQYLSSPCQRRCDLEFLFLSFSFSSFWPPRLALLQSGAMEWRWCPAWVVRARQSGRPRKGFKTKATEFGATFEHFHLSKSVLRWTHHLYQGSSKIRSNVMKCCLR